MSTVNLQPLLPNEVLLLIVNEITDGQTLQSLALVNRAMREFAQAKYYRGIGLVRYLERSREAVELVTRPRLAMAVKDVQISIQGMIPRKVQAIADVTDSEPTPTGGWTGRCGDWAGQMSLILTKLFGSCTSIESLRFDCIGPFPTGVNARELLQEFWICVALQPLAIHDVPKLDLLLIKGEVPEDVLRLLKSHRIAGYAPFNAVDEAKQEQLRKRAWNMALLHPFHDSVALEPRVVGGAYYRGEEEWWKAPQIPAVNNLRRNLDRVQRLLITTKKRGRPDDSSRDLAGREMVPFISAVAPTVLLLDHHYELAFEPLNIDPVELWMGSVRVSDRLAVFLRRLTRLRLLKLSRIRLHEGAELWSEIFNLCAALPTLQQVRLSKLSYRGQRSCSGPRFKTDILAAMEGSLKVMKPLTEMEPETSYVRLVQSICSSNMEDLSGLKRLFGVMQGREGKSETRAWVFCNHIEE